MTKKLAVAALGALALIAACTPHKNAQRSSTELTNIIQQKLDSISNASKQQAIYNINELYRASNTITFDIVHTALAVSFNRQKQWMYGKEALTMHAHFYPSDSLMLDAKGMELQKVGILQGLDTLPLNYVYKDSAHLHIKLNRIYAKGENFTLCFTYIAKPNERKTGGSRAISSDKGLYFINPFNKDPLTPRQIWTQGETESNSVWMITVDKPNMKSTHEIAITVEKDFTTLSNGLLVGQKDNNDGTRTDVWKMDLPIAPYLFMMAAGNFSITHDKWRNIAVDYYTDPGYAADANAIFGHTPEMIEYYSRTFGYPFPWPKYSQIIAHDYVSGAMENATATLHGEFVQMHKRAMIDGSQEEVICHELSHHWFGDLATCESWSNLTLNESFANYCEVLWMANKYGADEGGYINERDMNDYLNYSNSRDPDLVRFTYLDKEDMFDPISYNKGGRILNMLRYTVGDSAFFKSLSVYLKQNAFKAAEVNQLRLAFEEVTGEDLNWFFNQWYYNKSYPKLKIRYLYDDNSRRYGVIISQKPANESVTTIWKLKMAIDVYANNTPARYHVTMLHPVDTFYFTAAARPQLINVDADKMLLCQKKDNKSIDEFVFQYYHAPLYKDRLEALENAEINQGNIEPARQMITDALKDKYWRLRQKAIGLLDLTNETVKAAVKLTLVDMATKDPKSLVRVAALNKLAKYNDVATTEFYRAALSDSSYAVEAAALQNINALDRKSAYKEALTLQNSEGDKVRAEVSFIFVQSGDSSVAHFFGNTLSSGNAGRLYELFNSGYSKFLSRMPVDTIRVSANKLYEIATNNTTWWVKLLAMNALTDVKTNLNAAASSLKENGADIKKVNAINTLATDMDNRITAIKKAETDANLVKYWK